jgi:hypothetical protein
MSFTIVTLQLEFVSHTRFLDQQISDWSLNGQEPMELAQAPFLAPAAELLDEDSQAYL